MPLSHIQNTINDKSHIMTAKDEITDLLVKRILDLELTKEMLETSTSPLSYSNKQWQNPREQEKIMRKRQSV